MVDKTDTQVLQSKAWENLVKQVEYLNTFAGNRSENAKLTKMVKEAMDKAKEQCK